MFDHFFFFIMFDKFFQFFSKSPKDFSQFSSKSPKDYLHFSSKSPKTFFTLFSRIFTFSPKINKSSFISTETLLNWLFSCCNKFLDDFWWFYKLFEAFWQNRKLLTGVSCRSPRTSCTTALKKDHTLFQKCHTFWEFLSS